MGRGVLALALLVAMLLPSTVAAASGRCSLTITPTSGAATDIYRMTVSNVPVDPSGGSVEARLDIHRLGTREGSVIFAFLFPGVTQFYVDHNETPPGEPQGTLEPGRYLVQVTTPHLRGADACHAVAQFEVR